MKYPEGRKVTCGGEDRYKQHFVKKKKTVEGDYLQALGVDGRKIFIGSLRNRLGLGEVNWIDFVQYRGRNLAVLNAVMNFRVL